MEHWRCSNFIFILKLIAGFARLGEDKCKTRWETFKFRDLVHLILEILWYSVGIFSKYSISHRICTMFGNVIWCYSTMICMWVVPIGIYYYNNSLFYFIFTSWIAFKLTLWHCASIEMTLHIISSQWIQVINLPTLFRVVPLAVRQLCESHTTSVASLEGMINLFINSLRPSDA